MVSLYVYQYKAVLLSDLWYFLESMEDSIKNKSTFAGSFYGASETGSIVEHLFFSHVMCH